MTGEGRDSLSESAGLSSGSRPGPRYGNPCPKPDDENDASSAMARRGHRVVGVRVGVCRASRSPSRAVTVAWRNRNHPAGPCPGPGCLRSGGHCLSRCDSSPTPGSRRPGAGAGNRRASPRVFLARPPAAVQISDRPIRHGLWLAAVGMPVSPWPDPDSESESQRHSHTASGGGSRSRAARRRKQVAISRISVAVGGGATPKRRRWSH